MRMALCGCQQGFQEFIFCRRRSLRTFKQNPVAKRDANGNGVCWLAILAMKDSPAAPRRHSGNEGMTCAAGLSGSHLPGAP